MVHPDGAIRWVFANGRSNFEGEGGSRHLTSFNGTAADITDRKRNEEDLRASEERYRALFDSMDEGYCVAEVLFDAGGRPIDYRFLEVNPAFERQSGLVDATGNRMRELAPGHEAHWFETYGRVAETGEATRFEHQAQALGGRWFDVYAFRIGEPQERKVAILFTDITERKRAAERLRESEGRFRALVTATSDVVYRMSPDWSEMQPLDGRDLVSSTDEPSRDYMQKNVPSFEHGRVRDAIQEAISGKTTYELEHQVNRPDGSLGWTFSRAVPILAPEGEIVEWFGMASDVTARKRAEEALVRSERQAKRSFDSLYALVEQCPFGIYIIDSEFRIAAMNQGSQDGAFANVRPVIGRPFEETVRVMWPEPVATDVVREFRRTLDTGESYYSKNFIKPRADKDQLEAYEWETPQSHPARWPTGRRLLLLRLDPAQAGRGRPPRERPAEGRVPRDARP